MQEMILISSLVIKKVFMGYEMSKEYTFLGRLTIADIAGRCSHYVAQRAWRTDRDSKELDGIMEVIIDNILIFTYEFGFYNHCYTSRNALGFIEKNIFPRSPYQAFLMWFHLKRVRTLC